MSATPPVRLSRPADGRVMCCICFRYRTKPELFVDADGTVWDLCATGPCVADAGPFTD